MTKILVLSIYSRKSRLYNGKRKSRLENLDFSSSVFISYLGKVIQCVEILAVPFIKLNGC